jgi:L-threonylcarbamoyladenylate synthase
MESIDTHSIKEAVRILREGRIVAFPTGTSYGLAADTLQGFALQRVRNLKQRPAEKAFTVFMRPALWHTFLQLTTAEEHLLRAGTNHPLTLLVEPAAALAHLAQEGRVGVRCIDHPLMQALSEAIDVPLTATSANVAGEEPCYTVKCIKKTFPGKLDETTYDLSLGYILDGGDLPKTAPSTIAKIVDGKIEIARAGALTREKVAKLL